jgi:maltose alpha-D-glucosyltransferase/alpha-amylase
MQWTNGVNKGFSTAAPEQLYLPVDSATDAPNVADQQNDPNSLLNRVRRLIKLRKQEKTLQAYAEFVPVYAKKNTYPFIYARACDDEKILVVLNPAAKEATAKFTLKPIMSEYTLLAGSESEIVTKNNNVSITISGQSYSIYKMK